MYQFNVGTSLPTAVLDGVRQEARVPSTDLLTSKTLSLSIDEPALHKHASLSTKANLSKEVSYYMSISHVATREVERSSLPQTTPSSAR